MLNVQNYLLGKCNDSDEGIISALDSLNSDYGIKYNIWEDKLT